MLEFISYDGEYPNLCSGLLLVNIDNIKHALCRMAVLYDIYVMCQEHAYQDFKMFVQASIHPCEPDITRHSVCEGCDVYVLEWRNFKGWDVSPCNSSHEANVLREWIYGYVNINRPLDGDRMDFVCICEGESIIEHARNSVSSMPLDFYAHMVIHLPEDLGGWELL